MAFLFAPQKVLAFFNWLSRRFEMREAPEAGHGFYLILAVAYMYVVTSLAVGMARHPENRVFPLLLFQAKAASSFLSLALFIFHRPYLIYIVNAAVDGLIGLFVLWIYWKQAGRAGTA
jgi:hypothetical protein